MNKNPFLSSILLLIDDDFVKLILSSKNVLKIYFLEEKLTKKSQ